ncbi:MAG: hypothetical protein P1V34_16115, partial [Alphaproteobacteria bacterium]|nr:hypothetical protein [Alphaproteobacteria bacterium]
AQLTLEAMETRWKTANILRFDQAATTLMARVNVTSLQDWLGVQKSLNSVAPIKSWRLDILATDHAVLALNYFGDPERRVRALSRVYMGLSEDPKTPGSWILTRR